VIALLARRLPCGSVSIFSARDRLPPCLSGSFSFEVLILNMLNVDYRKVETLIPYARNPRTHSDAQVAKIAASIVEYGWTNPVLVDGLRA